MQPTSENQNQNKHYIPGDIAVEDVARFDTLENAYQHVAREYDFAKHRYFTWMHTTDKESFARSQIPFRYAVEGFSCALAATVAKIPELERRVKVAENVAEEHGLIDDKLTHKDTITEFITLLGIPREEVDTTCPPGVHAFNQSVRNYCLTNSPEAGAAMLGIIEYVFITISNVVAQHIAAQGWAKPGSQRHYEVHETLDIEHSRVLFDVCREYWPVELKRREICQGLILGAYYFWELYNELYPENLYSNTMAVAD
ncbi:MAG: iron-containing redox enzyme family protein [Gammaproteobacteria bacterium]|jgi:pyrroloquinoline-quinone synthase